ncbi:uncharacterized protein L201_007773 [Kwoniella dendrophila CBS 6074]|uniref:Cytochrome P450 n=1 Tax=Kwoniella dendrophila CBS 6074 TaxID=1295534 RepID=A0AAX4K6P9_9TREE
MRWSLDTMLAENLKVDGGGLNIPDTREAMVRSSEDAIRRSFGGCGEECTLVDHHKFATDAVHPIEEAAFRSHLYRMYREKRAELEGGSTNSQRGNPENLLEAMVKSQLDAEAEAKLAGGDSKVAGLTESEIIGNMWTLIFAGHDTSANTLTFALAYLALYPEWQEELYAEVAACGDPNFGDMPKLPLCTAVCLEALRLRDKVLVTMKEATVDAIIPYTTWNSDGNVTQRTHLVKQGSIIAIEQTATQLNPHAWGQDNLNVNPHRHLHTTPPFVGFATGQRQCIGKRFAETEMTSFISGLCSKYIIKPVKIHPEESWLELKERLIHSAVEEITLRPGQFSLRLEER